MAAGQLRAVVGTASLDLGIDWGDVDLVIQVGAPKGVVAAAAAHRPRQPPAWTSPRRAVLVPANRFEVLECDAALRGGRGRASWMASRRARAGSTCWRSTSWPGLRRALPPG